jgi:hypothetical protein
MRRPKFDGRYVDVSSENRLFSSTPEYLPVEKKYGHIKQKIWRADQKKSQILEFDQICVQGSLGSRNVVKGFSCDSANRLNNLTPCD